MSKVKQYYTDLTEKNVDDIISKYVINEISFNDAKSKIKLDVAVDKIKKVDNYEMVIDEHNIEDGLFYAKEDYWKKANAEGRSQ